MTISLGFFYAAMVVAVLLKLFGKEIEGLWSLGFAIIFLLLEVREECRND